MAAKKLPDVNAAHGAPMGRRDRYAGGDEAPLKFSLQRVPLDRGGYDSGGAYWGHGAPLYWAESEEGHTRFFRAKDRKAAKGIVREEFPAARFYN